MSDKYNILDAVKDAAAGNLEFADDDTIITRTQACNGCEVQFKATKICTACGCFIPAKVRLKKSSCPLGLW